ncbi:MAG: hypothetical protein ONB31_12985 [candidate division KSB1 bacterium]|nr:hypothetical protein [candidate division KSB1 bacterium]MDZ7336426.1 hypothetical protein [candidate division KSB1 bacterium]MDZ7358402.1 hypothetical protein [candidate division KSB1 bacterium]MDZ7399064.1 hypothetical protein [candidate division KSB1 bacterium]
MLKKKLSILMIIFLMGLSASALAIDYPGIGVICCGDLWESFMPSGINKYYSESKTDVLKNFLIVRMGNFERQWNTPTFHYPSGDIFTLTWNTNLIMTEYHPTEPIGEYRKSVASDTANYRNYCNAFWMASMGNTDKKPTSTGNAKGAALWTDASRTQQLYEFFMPTNIGVDVKGRIRAFSFNEANMNDFIAMEFELTNTGVQDNNCDGVIDRQNHKIEALAMHFSEETFGSMRISISGGRWSWGSWPASRLSGYDASPDPDGNPWDVPMCWATGIAESDLDANRWAADGKRKVAYRSALGIFSDIWNGQHFIAVKQGGMDAGPSAPDKLTIYGSHPIGEGAQRGWYVTRNRTKIGEPYGHFVMATGVFYEEGGKSEDPAKLKGKVLKPDPNYFDTSNPSLYTVGDPVSFKNLPIKGGQPMGDMKYTNFWFENWEKNFPGTPEPKIPAEDLWTKGGTPKTIYNFDSGASVGVGPFSLEVGETITVVAVEYAGYRLKGVRNALKAARWAYQNNWKVPLPPPMPDMKVSAVEYQEPSGLTVKPLIVWDNRAESAPDFAGYKIYRVTAYPKYNSAKFGTRFLDRYHHQGPNDIGLSDDELEAKFCEPINPNNSVPPGFDLDWDPGFHGPWKLMAYIPKAELSKYANTGADKATYQYAWIDESKEARFGYTYWYYVAAFDNETGTIAGRPFTSLESGKDNFNGRWGEWMGTYPFATSATDYPTDAVGRKNMGAPFVLNLPRADVKELTSGKKQIAVKPNPYKVQAPHDVGLEHKVVFYNLPLNTKITIFDLSGQIMDVIEYYGLDPQNGTVFWDMFTKDGPEVQSGLYIWVAEYPGGKQTGYLAIMR